jgi:hypothetical protein
MAIRRTSMPASWSRFISPAGLLRFAALVLLVAQLGIVAHRIEHYIAPEHMECGEDACDAFAPGPPAAEPILFVPPVFLVVFFLQFWTVRAASPGSAVGRLGFRAHAPPV